MFGTILRFELRHHLARPVTWLYFAVLFLLAFGFMSSDAILIGGGVGLVRKNSPYALTQLMLILTAIGQVITTALVGTAILRDFQHRSHELLFTTRITRVGYLGGRFLGAFLAMVVVYAGIPLGAWFGTLMPWMDADKLLPFSAASYAAPYLLFVVPNVFIISAIFFAVGALTRNLFAIYTQGILLLVAWSVTQQSLRGLDRDALANALDVFGLTSFDLTTRYWTMAERNTRLLGLDGFVLTNRLIWVGVALAVAAAAFLLFRFEATAPSFRFRRRSTRTGSVADVPAGNARTGVAAPVAGAPGRRVPPAARAPAAVRHLDAATARHQFLSTARFSTLRIVRDMPFIAIAAIAGINTFMNAWYADSLYDVTTWPVTHLVADIMTQGFFLFMIILTTIYAGESVWRERSLGADQVADALPVPTWATAAGKMVGVVLAQALLLAAMIPVGMLVQTLKGYYRYEPIVYLQFVFGTTLPWLVAITLFAFLVHALVNSKFLGHLVIIVYWVASVVMNTVGLEHQLYQYGMPPTFTYSDMNGFGHFVGNLALSGGYWLSVGMMLSVLAVLAWVRGTDSGGPARVAAARGRWSPSLRYATGGTAFASVMFGGAIFYNTNILNEYITSKQGNRERAEWERAYGVYAHILPPRIIDVDLVVDLEPERRAYRIAGRYLAVNTEAAPIDTVLVNLDRDVDVERLEWSRPAERVISDDRTGTYLFVLREPLPPGDTIALDYTVAYAAKGFPNSGADGRVVANGTFLASVGPSLGYNRAFELSEDDERRKQKLPVREPLPDLDDPDARRNAQFAIDSDWVRFRATISTSPDQIALAPGTLERQWEENGRRHFRYVMEQPIRNMTTVVSARYDVHRSEWNGVPIEVYHHPTHTFNIERMATAVAHSLDYFTANFSPYQFDVLRILEFPRYAGFAQSFPTTVPYSEGIGFILRVRDRDDDLDMPFFVTAHEVAHQWWGHQVSGANVQGSAFIVEGLAEYSALTVMEKRYGQASAHKFLRHELDRYLRGRSNERRREQPLIRTENQPYIHYNKGALALYALRDYIGDDAMNRALRGFLDEHAFETPPYSTARDLVAALRAETPDSLQYVVTDLFETITLFDNQAVSANAVRRDDGRYAVTLTVSARKVRADSVGVEIEVPLADYIDIGVFGEREPGNAMGRPLYLAKHRLSDAVTTLEIIVDEQPRRAGIDPYNKLIDRVPGDNVRAVGGR
jgi:ABC-2 type transport system permease protein